MDNQPAKPASPAPEKKAYGYSKRPLWQWIALYVVIGGAIYAAIYYFYFAKRGYSYTEPAPAPAGRPTGAMPVLNGQPTPPPPPGQPQNW